MTALADLVTLLLSTGIPPESISSAVDLAQKHGVEQVEFHRNSTGIPPENAAEKRKAWDRDRKRKIAETKKPPLILTSSLPDSKNPTEVESKKERRARVKPNLVSLPSDWKPPEHAYPLAVECGVGVPHVEGVFRDYLKSSGKLYADHDAAFCNFIRNQQKFSGDNGNGKDHGRRTVHDAARDFSQQLLRALDEPAPAGLCEPAGGGAVRLLPPG